MYPPYLLFQKNEISQVEPNFNAAESAVLEKNARN